MNSKQPCMDANIALHQILYYMPSSGESSDDSDDPVSGNEDTLMILHKVLPAVMTKTVEMLETTHLRE